MRLKEINVGDELAWEHGYAGNVHKVTVLAVGVPSLVWTNGGGGQYVERTNGAKMVEVEIVEGPREKPVRTKTRISPTRLLGPYARWKAVHDAEKERNDEWRKKSEVERSARIARGEAAALQLKRAGVDCIYLSGEIQMTVETAEKLAERLTEIQ